MSDTPTTPPPSQPPAGGAPPGGAPRPTGGGASGELVLDLDAPYEIARWRPLVHWLLAIPQLIVIAVLGWVAGILQVISFFTVLFVKNVPEGIYNFQVMTLRYTWRVYSYGYFMRESYPPFEFDMVQPDPGDDPASLAIGRPGEMDRWRCLQGILLIPQYIVLFFVHIAAAVVGFIAFFAVIFTGNWPEGMRRFVVGTLRWTNRVGAYGLYLGDKYPPYSLE